MAEDRSNIIDVELWYPGVDGNPSVVEIDLTHVRAADGLQVSYDFERDGWVVKQARIPFNVDGEDEWQEVGFFEAWALEESEDL